VHSPRATEGSKRADDQLNGEGRSAFHRSLAEGCGEAAPAAQKFGMHRLYWIHRGQLISLFDGLFNIVDCCSE